MSLPDLPFQYLLARGVIVDDKVIVYENNGEDIWSPSRRYQKVDPPVYWNEGTHLWKIIDESSPWYHIERYTLLVLDDNLLLKDFTAENRLLGTEWNQILPV
ncbi:hypothetical protein AVEN_133915-1 [Araneus ventricosus]|uniref:Uncharacterized protein n=1 Tax=Araneus ventricosus TaxID=182803 RepID=A0A4Y2D3C0_ARAVE|nr:hypothetical protein AVEN_133915-1 [Araneus ventricosus]